MMTRWIGLWLVVLVSHTLAFDGFHSVTPNIVTLGDPITYRVQMTLEPDETISSSIDTRYVGDNITIRDHQVSTEVQGNQSIITHEFSLALFQKGLATIPTRSIVIQTPTSQMTATLPSLQLFCQSVFATANQQINAAPNTPPQVITIDWAPYVKKGFIWALLVGIGIILVQLIRRRFFNKSAQSADVDVYVDPAEDALSRLATLKESSLLDSQQLQAYYLEFTDILKHYFGAIYDQHIAEMTTHETLTYTKRRLDSETQKRLKKILDLSDLVKFAMFIPDPTIHDDIFQKAVDIIHRTNPKDFAEQVAQPGDSNE